jgi:pantetheine-phosphate adenylyltransferase
MKIGVYAGSFNPFHRGHYNILQKAEKIFDKVIIARGINPEKNNDLVPFPKILESRAFMNYNGLLTDFIKTLPYDNVTIIRGLRNSVDLQYELNQYRYFQDLMPEVQVVSLFCDKEFEHISSSGIRALSTFGSDIVQKYLL